MWPVGWEESRSAALCRTSCPSAVHRVRLRSMRHDSPSTPHDPSHPTGRWHAEPYHQKPAAPAFIGCTHQHQLKRRAAFEAAKTTCSFSLALRRGGWTLLFVLNFRASRFEFRAVFLVPRPSVFPHSPFHFPLLKMPRKGGVVADQWLQMSLLSRW